VVRRYQQAAQPDTQTAPSVSTTRRVCIGTRTLDLDSRQLFDAGGKEIPLTRMEFELLEVLVARPNRPLSRDQLLNLTQNRDWDRTDRSIDIRIARLRRKIEPEPERPQVIRTVRSIGCMYVPTRA
jgi:two-component system phosphate regulon response regulator OmpR